MLEDYLQYVERDPDVMSSMKMMVAGWGWIFTTVVARLGGLFAFSPVLGQRGVSIGTRVALTMCLAFVITPPLMGRGHTPLPHDAWDAFLGIGGEFVIGALLGCGVLLLFAGIKLAGELIDQQAGIAMQEVFDPSGPGNVTGSGQLLTIVATLAFLCTIPGNGHLLIVSTLLDSFFTLPSTGDWSPPSLVLVISQFGRMSLSLGLQVAAPVLAAGAIVAWSVSAISQGSSPSPYAITMLGLPLRIVLSLTVLVMCLSGMTEAFLASVDHALQQFPLLVTSR